ncbi:DNA polymerase beta, mitochondrial, putative [Bodo saltans]|uniref:DNA polymerase n=1 Tax=Bodo saltans TaxID=75058 RepID=A0A0S4J8Y1_BODSA|nr:DNA polymerase beta, mitochondrial, putative [Bodo saltans]|eukprot:CUG86799.1 DNA polymerase beta, mitochondrial, putative [Bodo saltans]
MRKTISSLKSAPLATVIDALEQMASVNEVLGERFKVKSYRTAVASLRSLETDRLRAKQPLSVDLSEIANLAGVGAKIQKKVEEIISTGKLQELEKLKQQPIISAIGNLTKVHGIGPQKAKQLFEEHKISTVKDLRASSVELTDAQAAGLEFFDDIQLQIPQSEVKDHEKHLQNAVRLCLGPQYVTTVCGSFRRGKPTSGDVDALLAVDPQTQKAGRKSSDKDETAIQTLTTHLSSEAYWLRTLATGSTKCMGICRLESSKPARRVDIRLVTSEAYPFALLYFTGSKAFNVRMRQQAAEKGLTLNEYGLFRVPPSAPSKKNEPPNNKHRVLGLVNEKDIFDAVGMAYLLPHERSE